MYRAACRLVVSQAHVPDRMVKVASPHPRVASESCNSRRAIWPSVTEGVFLFISLTAGDPVADVGCPLVFHDKTLLVAISVYVGNVLSYYQLHPLQRYLKTPLRENTTVGIPLILSPPHP